MILGLNLSFCFDSFSKSSGIVIDNNILDDIQVIEPEIQSSDQDLYNVSSSLVLIVFTYLFYLFVKRETSG